MAGTSERADITSVECPFGVSEMLERVGTPLREKLGLDPVGIRGVTAVRPEKRGA